MISRCELTINYPTHTSTIRPLQRRPGGSLAWSPESRLRKERNQRTQRSIRTRTRKKRGWGQGFRPNSKERNQSTRRFTDSKTNGLGQFSEQTTHNNFLDISPIISLYQWVLTLWGFILFCRVSAVSLGRNRIGQISPSSQNAKSTLIQVIRYNFA